MTDPTEGPKSRITGDTGVVHRTPGGNDVITFRRTYPDPPDAVWSALTESDRLARWFGSYTGDARPGGTVALTMTSAEDSGGDPAEVRIRACEPARRLVVSIHHSGADAWDITVTLEPGGDGTVLHFRQVLPPGFAPTDVGPGWHWYLDRLAATLTGDAFPSWDDYQAALPARYA